MQWLFLKVHDVVSLVTKTAVTEFLMFILKNGTNDCTVTGGRRYSTGRTQKSLQITFQWLGQGNQQTQRLLFHKASSLTVNTVPAQDNFL